MALSVFGAWELPFLGAFVCVFKVILLYKEQLEKWRMNVQRKRTAEGFMLVGESSQLYLRNQMIQWVERANSFRGLNM